MGSRGPQHRLPTPRSPPFPPATKSLRVNTRHLGTLHQQPLGCYSSPANLKPTSSPPASAPTPQRKFHSPDAMGNVICPPQHSFSLAPARSQTGFPLAPGGGLPLLPLPPRPPSCPLHYTRCNPIGWKCSLSSSISHILKIPGKEPTQIKEFQVCASPSPFSSIHKADH